METRTVDQSWQAPLLDECFSTGEEEQRWAERLQNEANVLTPSSRLRVGDGYARELAVEFHRALTFTARLTWQ